MAPDDASPGPGTPGLAERTPACRVGWGMGHQGASFLPGMSCGPPRGLPRLCLSFPTSPASSSFFPSLFPPSSLLRGYWEAQGGTQTPWNCCSAIWRPGPTEPSPPERLGWGRGGTRGVTAPDQRAAPMLSCVPHGPSSTRRVGGQTLRAQGADHTCKAGPLLPVCWSGWRRGLSLADVLGAPS